MTGSWFAWDLTTRHCETVDIHVDYYIIYVNDISPSNDSCAGPKAALPLTTSKSPPSAETSCLTRCKWRLQCSGYRSLRVLTCSGSLLVAC